MGWILKMRKVCDGGLVCVFLLWYVCFVYINVYVINVGYNVLLILIKE